MSRFYSGMIVRTSYNTGPYEVISYQGGCTCPRFIDAITLHDNAPESKPHYHLQCKKVGEKGGNYYLNGYDENLNSVWCKDYLVDVSVETTMLALDCQ